MIIIIICICWLVVDVSRY